MAEGQTIRIFLSSPGDVAEERRLARDLIEGALRKEPAYRGRLSIEYVAWDDPDAPTPRLATQVPQASVNAAKPPPSQCDIVVVVLWSRLGSPFELDGRRWDSGTEWEYEDAVGAPGKPDILVYRCTSKPRLDELDLRDPQVVEKLVERQAQYQAVEAFLSRLQDHAKYADPPAFRERLEQDLRHLLARRLTRLENPVEPIPTGSPDHRLQMPVLRTGRIAYLGAMPRLPERYQPRTTVLDTLKAKLKTSVAGVVGIAAAAKAAGLLGMGGIGKTMLAAALVQDEAVRSAFPGGIVWLTFGRDASIAAKQAELAFALTGVSMAFRDAAEGREQLKALAEQLREPLLIVLDDVWQPEAADGFSGLSATCRLLVTTRDRRVLRRLQADENEIGLLGSNEARAFLAEVAGTQAARLPKESEEVLKQCGGLPLALAAIGALVREGVYTWADVVTALRESALKDLDASQLGLPGLERDLVVVLAVSVEALKEPARACFFDFAVVREDVAVPEATLVRLWSEATGGERQAKLLAQELVDRSLLRRDEQRRYLVHDLYHDYLRYTATPLTDRHATVVERYRAACPDGWASGPDDGYFFQNLLWHLQECGAGEEACRLLFDAVWLRRKLVVAGVGDLVADCQYLPDNTEAQRLEGVLRLAAPLLTLNPDHLWTQLCGRLVPEDGLAIADLLAQARRCVTADVMIPRTDGFLDRPGALIGTFRGHSGGVSAVAVLPDGRCALSGSSDKTLFLWDLETGGCLRRFEGHSNFVNAVAVLPDGQRALSGSSDKTLLLWNLETGASLRHLKGHSGWVNAVTVLPDGRRALSGSDDKTLRLWDLETGAYPRSLEGHSGPVNAVAVLPDGGRALSGSDDKTLRLWDLETGACLRHLEGHSGPVNAVAVLPDGRHALSGSDDKTLRLWDLETGACLRSLEGHSSRVNAVTVLPDGRRALSGAWDNTLRLWDLETGACLRGLEGHSGGVTAVAVLPDGGRALSGSHDSTLRLWDLETDETLRSLDDHSNGITAVAVLPDGGRALSGSSDNTLRLWDLKTGTSLRSLEGHSSQVTAVAVLPDDRHALSGSSDKTLRLWDLQTGARLRRLEGHSNFVTAVAVLPDGRRALSGSSDKTLLLWDLDTGACLRSLEGHSDWVTAVAVLPDGRRALSGSWDNTLRLWDLDTGTCLRRLEGHSHWINAVAVLPDGRRALSGSHDTTLRLWDLETGAEIARFMDDHAVTACVASPNASVIVVGNARGRVLLFDISTLRCREVPPT